MSRKNELDLHVEQLYNDGHRSYDDLCDYDIEMLTSMIMEKSSRRDRLDFITDTDTADEVANRLSHLLLDPQREEALELVEIMKEGAKKLAKNRINELLEIEAIADAYRNSLGQISETEIMEAAHCREVAQEMNGVLHA